MDYNRLFIQNLNVNKKSNNKDTSNLVLFSSFSKFSLTKNKRQELKTFVIKKKKKRKLGFCSKFRDENNFIKSAKSCQNLQNVKNNVSQNLSIPKSLHQTNTYACTDSINIYKSILSSLDNISAQDLIDTKYKDFDYLINVLNVFNKETEEGCFNKSYNLCEIEKKLVKIFRDRILDLKLLLCLKNIKTIEKEIFNTILIYMKTVINLCKKEDYYKLFFRIANEFVSFDLSYIYFIKIIECYLVL